MNKKCEKVYFFAFLSFFLFYISGDVSLSSKTFIFFYRIIAMLFLLTIFRESFLPHWHDEDSSCNDGESTNRMCS